MENSSRFNCGQNGDGMRYFDGKLWRKAAGGELSNVGHLGWVTDEWRGLAANPMAKRK